MSEHIITVQKIPGEDDFDFIVKQCLGDSRCTYWLACEQCDTARLELTEEEAEDEAYFAHGAQHQLIEGEWMTDTGRCGLELDGGRDGAFQFAFDHGPGVYEVEVDYWGDGFWQVDHLRTLTRPRQLIHNGRKPKQPTTKPRALAGMKGVQK